MGFELRPYQIAASQSLRAGWTAETVVQRQLLVMATGLGKTVQFANEIDWVLKQGGRALVIAHRDELLNQATEKIALTVEAGVSIGKEKAELSCTIFDKVVVASIATIGRAGADGGANDRLKEFPKDYFKLVVIDEAHHATSDMYKRVIDYFCGRDGQTFLLGVTATPNRTDEEDLHDIFDRVAFKMDIVDGTKARFLCPIVSHRVSSKTDISGVRTRLGDYSPEDLARRVNNAERNSLIVDTYLNKFSNRQAMVFAANVDHAIAIREDFVKKGVSCECVSGETDEDSRKEWVQKFKSGELSVLTNFGIFTEGFDYEALDLIINARPTRSALLLTQIAGRETRLFAGKSRADFVEIVDGHSEETATCAEIFGFKQKFDCQGHDFLECLLTAEDMLKKKPYFDPYVWSSWAEMVRKFDQAKAIDEIPYIDSRYRWYETRNHGLILRLKAEEKPRAEEQNQEAKHYMFKIRIDALGGFVGNILETTRFGQITKNRYELKGTSRDAVVKMVENAVLVNKPHWDSMLNLNAPWRFGRVSDGQWSVIERNRLTPKSRDQLTKGQATDLISRMSMWKYVS